ncbi:YkgJ family cysteine cluster protein [Methanocella conradii]|uniref:YkgJ family cysteine cluster protein n=1 Tax=Methanocella conradii TaxID=1175444 RepID=UPI0024B3C92E|nr:YkgJ family cysteine cluster protein [Methanocella conradii]MDI6896720.1 YkgJ family cysteine cluster protein [Methanocella conradii]
MVSEGLLRFFKDNPMVYGGATREELEQLSRIHELYPDSARLLTDCMAVELPFFRCLRCGECCSVVRYITVCHEDVKRWAFQGRLDILDSLAIDERRTPLLALKKDEIKAAKAEAWALLESLGICSLKVYRLLYVTRLLECAVYVKRSNGACVFLEEKGDMAACSVHDTKPLVCKKFPYYIGKYTDSRLIKEDSFCPSLRATKKKK